MNFKLITSLFVVLLFSTLSAHAKDQTTATTDLPDRTSIPVRCTTAPAPGMHIYCGRFMDQELAEANTILADTYQSFAHGITLTGQDREWVNTNLDQLMRAEMARLRNVSIRALNTDPGVKESWSLIIGTGSQWEGGLTHIDGYTSQESCLASAKFAAGHNTPTAYCVLVK